MTLDTIEAALDDLRAGRMIIVVDDEDRENEGDLTMAAEMVTPEAINFMARYGRGLICLPMPGERLDELQIPMMVNDNTSSFGTAFTISVEARKGVTTGISAADRSTTVKAMIDPETRPADIARPGHIFPLRARDGGVLERAGQTEAAVDLTRIAGMYPSGVICEIMNEDGTMARLPHLKKFAAEHQLRVISIADLIQYRLRTEKFVHEVQRAEITTPYGDFTAVVFENHLNGRCHLALVKGDISGDEPVLVRVQVQSVPGDVFLSQANPSGEYLQRCLELIGRQGRGVVLYLCVDPDGRHMAREISACRQIVDDDVRSYHDEQVSQYDPKEYGIGAQMLNTLGLRKIVLLTCHPRKYAALHGYNLAIVAQRDVNEVLSRT